LGEGEGVLDLDVIIDEAVLNLEGVLEALGIEDRARAAASGCSAGVPFKMRLV
jgi:hypothetical protein